jgi:phosphomannomutase/phosphoglucomutase
VHDIGLALSPMAYFAQFELDVPCVAMVTASHNDNGWTGVKMGANRPLTFGPDEMNAPEGDRAERRRASARPAAPTSSSREFPGTLYRRPDQAAEAEAPAQGRRRLRQRHRRAPSRRRCWRLIGCEVIEMDVDLDHTFPKYNPNPGRHGDAARDGATR